MKKIIFFAFIITVLNACNGVGGIKGSGNIVTETRATGNFSGIDAGGAFEVELQNGANTEVRVEADDNIIKDIETTVSGNTLHITTKEGLGFNNGTYKIYITAPEVNAIKCSGAATINIKNVLKSNDKLLLEASGASTIKGEVDAPEISADASGASNINVKGQTKKYTAEANGSSTLKTADLMSESTTVHASGASSAYVFASVSLDADADGAAGIHYKGAGNVTQKTSGAASIKKDD